MLRPICDHVIVVGGGLIGLGVGWKLCEEGCRVTLLEANQLGGKAASAAAAGMLAATAEVNFEESTLLALNHYSAHVYGDFVRDLEEKTQLDVDYRTGGSLVVALDRDDTEALKRLLDYQHRQGLEATFLSGEEARALEPALAPGVHGAVLCPHDHHVDPTLLLDALAEAFRRAGGVLHEHAPVESLLLEGSPARVTGVKLAPQDRDASTDSEVLHADRVLIAAGAWTRRLGGIERKLLPRVRPVVGQMIALDLKVHAEPLCERVIRAPDAYLVPRSSGELIIGASMEERGFDGRELAGHVFELLRGAWEAMPGIYDLPILRTWTGFRPLTLHNEPVLGPSREVEGLWFATGHGRNGVLLTAVTAIEMARSITRGELTARLEPFAP